MSKREEQILKDFQNIDKDLEGQQITTDKGEVIEDISPLTDNDKQSLDKEVELQRKYGDQDLRTFIEAGASAASFGVSDQALAKFGGEEMREALRERRQRNTEAALAGEIAGVVGPALATGGTSLAAQGLSVGVKGAARAGSFIEKLSAKQLAKVINETGKQSLAKQVITKSIPKSAGSAVEGAFYGAGQLISEEALGNAEFNAQNMVAYTGAGALIGGAAGGVLGSVEALVPVIRNNKVTNFINKKLNTNIDKRMAGAKLAKMSSTEISKLKDSTWGQQIYDNIPDYFKKNLNLKISDDLDSLYNKSNAELTRLGDEIGETALKIDRIAKDTPILPTKSKIALKVQNSLRELEEQFLKSPDELAKKSLTKIKNRIASWDEWLSQDVPIKATEIKELKTSLQKAAKWNKSLDQIPLDGKMDRQIAEAVRKEFLDLADNVSTLDANLGQKLRKLNIDYGTGLTITNKLKRAVEKEAEKDILGFKDILIADVLTDLSGGAGAATGAVVAKKFLESDFRRKLTLLADLEKANIRVNKKIAAGVKSFFTKPKKAAIPASTKILLSTNFHVPSEDGSKPKKPKDKKEAFNALSTSLRELERDPQKLLNHLQTNALSLTNAAPLTAISMNETLTKAISFLTSKLPRDGSLSPSLFSRKYEPSSLEIAKFERYLAAVEDPMSVLDDLESGSITRESVEALQAVYPDIYQRVYQNAVEQIVENPDLPYDKRVQLGILLDMPSDASLLPENITALQQTFADEQQQQQAAMKQQTAVNTTQGGLEKLNLAEDSKTQTEKVATRQ